MVIENGGNCICIVQNCQFNKYCPVFSIYYAAEINIFGIKFKIKN